MVERVGAIASVRANTAATADLIESGLVAVREVQAWCDAQHAGLVEALAGVDSFPEQRIAKASKKSLSNAAKTTERSATLTKTPKLADALGDGAITADHVDAVTRASKKLDAAKRPELMKRANALAEVAKAGTVEQFTRRLDLETKRLQEGDGLDRLARQRRNVRARTWVDPEGMWNLAVKFDPVTGVKIAARIDAMVQALFGETVPVECPDDPIEKQRYLAAHAIARLLLDEALANTPRRHGDDTPTATTRHRCARSRDDPSSSWSSTPTPTARWARSASSRSLSRSPPACSPPSPVTPTSTLSSCATGRAARTRRTEPGTHHTVGEPGATPCVARSVPVLCDPRLHGRLRPLQTPPHHLVAQPGPHRPRQPPARLQRSITPRSTTTAGSSNSDPTDNSPCASPTAASNTRARRHAPGEVPPPDRSRSGTSNELCPSDPAHRSRRRPTPAPHQVATACPPDDGALRCVKVVMMVHHDVQAPR